MNLKLSTTMAVGLAALTLISVTSIHQDAFAQGLGMSITATAEDGSDTIKISGHTASQITDVTFRVTSPSGNNIVGVGQISPDENGDFMTEFKVGPTWKEDGLYKITAMQSVHENSLYTLSVRVQVANGMTTETSVSQSNMEPEFFESSFDATEVRSGLSINANAIEGSTIIGIEGTTNKAIEDITIKVISPNGNVVSVDQISPNSDGSFAKDIVTGGPLWSQDGEYEVVVQQGESSSYKDSVKVEIIDGVVIPEFGAIAALILAMAIISIIAVSAKSRLSIMPKY